MKSQLCHALYGYPFLITLHFLVMLFCIPKIDIRHVFMIIGRTHVSVLMAAIVCHFSEMGGIPSNEVHGDFCICKECRLAWIPSLMRQIYPALRSLFKALNYVAFGIAIVHTIQNFYSLMSMVYLAACIGLCILFLFEQYIRIIVSSEGDIGYYDALWQRRPYIFRNSIRCLRVIKHCCHRKKQANNSEYQSTLL